MSIRAATLYVEIGADTRGAEEGMKRVDKGMSQLGDVGKTALGVALGNAITGVGQKFVQLGGEALTAYSDFERMGASLQQLAAKELLNQGAATSMEEALSKTSVTAQELQSWVQKLAIQSPFTSQGVADAFKMSMAYGFTTEQSKRLTQAMIDFSSGSGASESTMSRIALALGQIHAKGKLAGGEVMQLTEAGLSVDAILSKAFNKSTAEIIDMREKGLIPADEAIQAIVESLEKDFGGAAQRQGTTISGLVSSLEDIKNLGEIGLFGPIFREFQPDLQNFTEMLQDPKTMTAVSELGKTFAGTARTIVEDGQQVIEWFSTLQGETRNTVAVMGLLTLNAGTTIKVLGGIGDIAMGLPGVISGVGDGFKAWKAGMSLVTSLEVAFGKLPVQIGAVGLAIAAVGGAYVMYTETITNPSRAMGKAIGTELDKVRTETKSATAVVDAFVSQYKTLDANLKKQGLTGALFERGEITKAADLSSQLVNLGVSYKTYQGEMLRAAEAAGLWDSHQAQMILKTGDQERITSYLADRMGYLTSQEYSAALAAEQQRLAAENSVSANKEAADGADRLSASFKEGGAKALEMKQAAEQIPGVMKDIEGAQKTLAEAITSWRSGAANDVVSQLDKWGIKGQDLVDAYGVLDRTLGTSLVTQYQQEQAISRIVEQFAKNKNVDEFGKSIDALRGVFEPLDTKVRNARDALSELEKKLADLNGKTVTIDVQVTGGSAISGPTGTNNGRVCFVAGTPVNTPAGERPIDQIQTGDAVITLTVDGPVTSYVVNTTGGWRNDLVQVLLQDGRQYTCSPNHRFATARGWVVAAALQCGDVLTAMAGQPYVYQTIHWEGRYQVYNLEVDHPDHTYCVAGVVVHNGKAEGGSVWADGDPYIVGERGPEMFIPPQNGRVMNAGETSSLISALQGVARLGDKLQSIGTGMPSAQDIGTAVGLNVRDQLVGLVS